MHYVFLDTIRRRKVVHDVATVSGYWAKLGFPTMTYSHPDTSELVYHVSRCARNACPRV